MTKAADSAYLEALLQKRIAFAKQIRQQLELDNSIAQRTTELYNSFLEEIISEIVTEVHREAKTVGAVLSDPVRRAKEYKVPKARAPKAALDVFGNPDALGLSEEVTCNSCGRRIAASRFAPHLEKCMGKGRNASRANTRS